MSRLNQKAFLEFIRRPTETESQLRRSTRYYLNKLPYYEENPWFASWNWAAFFFGFVWMFYRKMYFFGFITFFLTKIILGLSTISSKLFYEGYTSPAFLVQELDRLPLMFVWMVFVGVFSNALYFNFVDRTIHMGKKKRNGTNIWIALLALIFSQALDVTQIKMHEYYKYYKTHTTFLTIPLPS